MKLIFLSLLLLGVGALAEDRVKRQASYTFPGPRSDRSYNRQAAASYRSSQPQNAYAEEQDDGELYQVPRRQFQAQPVQPQYPASQTQPRGPPPVAQAPPPPPPPPVYEQPRTAAPEQRQQYTAPAPKRRASSTRSRANKYGSAPQQSLNGEVDEDEEEQGPDPLTLLLQDSQFTCGGKNDGYYADDSVNCQVFHYCVGGAKHSWMCPENTVFHQVHLNCVPDAQDICAQSQKFHFVNEYLYKPVDYQGPNNTARYSQRYYPDGYVVGDPIVPPQEHASRRPVAPPPQVQSYPAPAPAPRQAPRQLAPQAPSQPVYRAPAQPPSSAPSRPASRPSRPLESYPVEVPQGYRGGPSVQAGPSPQAYRGTSSQSAAPQSYRGPPQPAPSPQSGYSEDNIYQPQPQSRRPSSAAAARSSAGYAPRQQYRSTSARSGYPAYGSNQAAGVQYDEDY